MSDPPAPQRHSVSLWDQPRRVLLLCVLLDLVGVCLGSALVDRLGPADLLAHPSWVLGFAATYVLLSWLFGSYTLLRWPRLRFRQMLVRLGVSALGTAMAVVLAGWLLKLPVSFTLAHRRVQIGLMSVVTLWAFLTRLVIWAQVRRRQSPFPTPLALAEHRQQRLLPSHLPEDALTLEDIPWSNSMSVERQLKRTADVAVALLLLLLSMPVMSIAALLIWLEDRGPVFYVQERSGLMGATFRVYKLRTMRATNGNTPATWTQRRDQRITRVGWFLRRVRLDELPQLLNVLIGDMSLIGPRPERPALEHELEAQIRHYRKRHWMPPGLSGWAQVCAPYAASIEEAELKLSYDLFYLRHWNIGLDLLILLKTVKTILKASGR